MLPHGVQEREDTLRSELKIRGGETIKSELAGRLAKAVVKGMRGGRKKVDRLDPDVTSLVDIGDGSVVVTSKPLFLYGRYTKPRGVAQRRLFCEGCNGRGCERCQGTRLLRRLPASRGWSPRSSGLCSARRSSSSPGSGAKTPTA